MPLQRGETTMAGFIEPDQEPRAIRERAQIKITVVIHVGRDDRKDAAGQLQNLRRRTRDLDNDVRLGWARKDHRIQHAVTVEVGPNRRVHWIRREAERGDERRDDGKDPLQQSFRFGGNHDSSMVWLTAKCCPRNICYHMSYETHDNFRP